MRKAGTVLVDRYRLERLLGEGGQGAVYLGTHLKLNHLVAIKEMPLRVHSEEKQQAALKQFRYEAQTLSGLHHPHLPRVHDFFEVDECAYLVMDYIEGSTLRTVVESKGAQPEVLVLQWCSQLCDVLHYLHTHDPLIVFRDLKPANIMLSPSGDLFLIDFGIAKSVSPDNEHTATIVHSSGTAGFAALEQYRGGTDVRTDIYALGATLYNLLTGSVPAWAVIRATGAAGVKPLCSVNPLVSKRTGQVVDWMLAMQPDKRPQSIQEIRDVLYDMTREVPEPPPYIPDADEVDMQKTGVLSALPRETAHLPSAAGGFSVAVVLGVVLTLGVLMYAAHRVQEGAPTPSPTMVVAEPSVVALATPVAQPPPPPPTGGCRLIGTAGALVRIDGQPKGTTPVTVQNLSVGHHSVALVRKGFTSRTVDIDIEAGPPQVVSVFLDTAHTRPTAVATARKAETPSAPQTVVVLPERAPTPAETPPPPPPPPDSPAATVTVTASPSAVPEPSQAEEPPPPEVANIAAPTLNDPGDAASVSAADHQVTLSWKAIDEAAQYGVEVQTTPPSRSRLVSTVSFSLASLDISDPNLKKVRWRVWGITAAGLPGPRSDWRTFTITH